MSFDTISIVRRFPIINNYVIVPDYGPNKVSLATALGVSGTSLNGLVGNFAEFVDTTPGVVECCNDVPANDISETVKDTRSR